MAKKILLINGPNLNLLGTREPDRYGPRTLAAIEKDLTNKAETAGAGFQVFQSNTEGLLVDRIQQAGADGTDFIVINPAAYTHTSVAIRDALAAIRIPFVEIHLTNIHARDAFRQRSFVSDLATGCISGLGAKGYELALDFALAY